MPRIEEFPHSEDSDLPLEGYLHNGHLNLSNDEIEEVLNEANTDLNKLDIDIQQKDN